MAFIHVQGVGTQTTTATTTVTLGTPIPGNILCAGIVNTAVTGGLTSITDGNGVPFNITPNSPSPNVGGAQVWLAYLVVPNIPSTTVVLKFLSGFLGSINLFVDEFSNTAGTIVFEKDIGGKQPSSGTTINVPSITPTINNSLTYATAYPSTDITAPIAGATLGSWTGAAGGIRSDGSASEYILNQAASSIAVNFTISPSGNWTAMVMSLHLSGGSGGTSSSWLTVANANSLRGLKH